MSTANKVARNIVQDFFCYFFGGHAAAASSSGLLCCCLIAQEAELNSEAPKTRDIHTFDTQPRDALLLLV